MANEATVQSSLNIRKGSLFYQSQPSSFRADVDNTNGPSPGAITVSTAGTNVDFSQLTAPSLCRIMNLSDDYYVTVGIWEPDTSLFYPLLEIRPGESYVIRLTRDIGEQYQGTGTGTGTANNRVRIKARGGAAVVLVEAFDE